MLIVDNVTKCYGNHVAVSGLSFRAEKGEVIGLLGLNGAGKSTTMNMVTGFSSPTEGDILLNGVSIAQQPLQARRNVGYLPEIPSVYQDLTVREQLTFVCRARGIPRGSISAEIDRVCALTDTAHVCSKLVRTLSKGYRQRVGLAMALVGDPSLLVLDEPTVGLDPGQIVEIRKLIASLAPEHTILISSHILSEVFSVCTRILILKNGVKRLDEPAAGFLERNRSAAELVLQMSPQAPDVTGIVAAVPGVCACVRQEGDPSVAEYAVQCEEGRDCRQDILRALAGHYLYPMAFFARGGSLEETFLNIVS